MQNIQNLLQFIVETLIAELIIVIIGVLFAQIIQRWWDRRRYGNWRVVILKNGKEVLDKGVSSGKAKAILEIPEDMGVFLKGLISPFGWVNCDLMDDGPKISLLTIDKDKRRIIVDLDKNPIPPENATSDKTETNHTRTS